MTTPSQTSRAAFGCALFVLAPIASAIQGTDDCANAQAIQGLGTFAFDNGNATDSPQSLNCGMARDVWFRWTSTETSRIEIATCGLTAVDTALAVYGPSAPNCPIGISALACNDDSDDCGMQSTQSALDFDAVQGETYIVRVGTWSSAPNGGAGSFTVALSTFVPGCPNPLVGPNVVAAGIETTRIWDSIGGVSAYSFSTSVCNTGDAELDWIANSPRHPVVAHNLYRLEDGQFEQIGMSWAKHGFAALQSGLCCNCIASGTASRLGVGCSDVYTSSLNGFQPGLGPRGEINAASGQIAWPIGSQQPVPGISGTLDRRMQVSNADLDPALHTNARYFVEAVYVAVDDAAAGNTFDNASFQEFDAPGIQSPQGAWRLFRTGEIARGLPAVVAWASSSPSARVDEIRVPGEGTIWVASDATDEGGGTWRYDTFVYNLSSDRAVAGLSMPAGVNARDLAMTFPEVHSGELRSNEAWTPLVQGGAVSWTAADAATDPNANAILWGTGYSFSYRSDAPPVDRAATLQLFRGAGPAAIVVPVRAPGPLQSTIYCEAELNTADSIGRLLPLEYDAVGQTLDLIATGLPASAFGMVVTSRDEDFVPLAGGSAGNLCLGGAIGRSVGASTALANLAGEFEVTADLSALPQPSSFATVMPGETWRFQGWYRDGSSTSNFTTALRVQF